MKKQRLVLHLVALVPLLLFVWSSPAKVSVNSAATGPTVWADFSTGGAFSGFSSIVNSIIAGENGNYTGNNQPVISWASHLSLAHEARMNGKLKIARKEIRSALNLLMSTEHEERNRCSDKSSFHVSWPYNASLALVLEEATEISREMAEYNTAEKYSSFALKGVESALQRNENSSELLLEQAKLLNTIASIKLQQAVYNSKVIKLIDKAESILNKCTGPLHSERGTMFHNKAMVEHYRKNYKAAIRLYLLAMSIRQQSDGEQAEVTAETYGDLGLLYAENNNFSKGIPLINQAIEIYSKKRGSFHPWTNWYCDQLGYLLLRAGRYDEAVSYLKRAKKGRKAALGKKHSLTKRTKKMLKTAKRWAKRTRKKKRSGKSVVAARMQTISSAPQ